MTIAAPEPGASALTVHAVRKGQSQRSKPSSFLFLPGSRGAWPEETGLCQVSTPLPQHPREVLLPIGQRVVPGSSPTTPRPSHLQGPSFLTLPERSLGCGVRPSPGRGPGFHMTSPPPRAHCHVDLCDPQGGRVKQGTPGAPRTWPSPEAEAG